MCVCVWIYFLNNQCQLSNLFTKQFKLDRADYLTLPYLNLN